MANIRKPENPYVDDFDAEIAKAMAQSKQSYLQDKEKRYNNSSAIEQDGMLRETF